MPGKRESHLSRIFDRCDFYPVFLRYVCLSLAAKLNDAVANTQPMPLKERVARALRRFEVGDCFSDIARRAKNLNVSNRQLLRILKVFCEEGVLVHEKKGVYRLLRKP